MNSEDVANYIKEHNYNLSNHEYIWLVKNTKTIDHIKYDSYSQRFDIWTKDGYYFNISVYKTDNKLYT